MKRGWLFLLLIAALGALAWTAGQHASVQVKSAPLRSRPHYFLGETVATLSHGDRVSVVKAEGVWVLVKAETREGWVNESALTEKRIVLESSDKPVDVKAADAEIALAGRGFSQEVEQAYRARNPKARFETVDRMSTDPLYRATDAELAAFLREGGVHPAEGGER